MSTSLGKRTYFGTYGNRQATMLQNPEELTFNYEPASNRRPKYETFTAPNDKMAMGQSLGRQVSALYTPTSYNRPQQPGSIYFNGNRASTHSMQQRQSMGTSKQFLKPSLTQSIYQTTSTTYSRSQTQACGRNPLY